MNSTDPRSKPGAVVSRPRRLMSTYAEGVISVDRLSEAVADVSPARLRDGRFGQSAEEQPTVGGPYESFSDHGVALIVNL